MNDNVKVALCIVGAALCFVGAGVAVHVFSGSWNSDAAPTAVAGPALVADVCDDGVGEYPDSGDLCSQEMFVYVTGAVRNPGVYPVPRKMRVFQLVDKAGGLTMDADVDRINMAGFVRDGMHLQIPSQGKSPSKGSTGGSSGASPVYINTASATDLCTLPGIGPVTAEKIIALRNQNGSFRKPEDLLKIQGIGKAKLGKIRHLLRF